MREPFSFTLPLWIGIRRRRYGQGHRCGVGIDNAFFCLSLSTRSALLRALLLAFIVFHVIAVD